MQFTLDMPAWPSALGVEPLCVRYEQALNAWSAEGVGVEAAINRTATTITCHSMHGSGTYTVAFARASGTTPHAGLPPLGSGNSGAEAVAAMPTLAIVIIAMLGACSSILCATVALCCKRKKDKAKELLDGAMDEEIRDTENNIESLPRNDITITLPCGHEVVRQGEVRLDFHLADEDEGHIGTFMDVGRDPSLWRS